MAPVVLVHCLRASGKQWAPQLKLLESLGVPTLAPDLPGHGSRLGEPFTIAGATDTIAQACQELGGKAVVSGLSLGGYLALNHRATRPHENLGTVATGCTLIPSSFLVSGAQGAMKLCSLLPAEAGTKLNRFTLQMFTRGAADCFTSDERPSYGLAHDAIRELRGLDLAKLVAVGASPLWLVSGKTDPMRVGQRKVIKACHPALLHREVIKGGRHTPPVFAASSFNRVLMEAIESATAPFN